MSPNLAEIKLETLAYGAAGELFDREFERVLENIRDVNTPAKAVREVTLKVAVKPHNENRETGDIKISATAKLADYDSAVAPVFLSLKKGNNKAHFNDPRQSEMDFIKNPIDRTADEVVKEEEGAQ